MLIPSLSTHNYFKAGTTIEIILFIGFISLKTFFKIRTYDTYIIVVAISKLKLRPRLVSKPELVIKYSSTPTTDIAGSVLSHILLRRWKLL
jgi:hypothetical protein